MDAAASPGRPQAGDAPLTAERIGQGVARALAAADAVVAEALALDSPSFEQLFGRLDHAGRLVRRAYGSYAFPRSVHPDAGVRAAAEFAAEEIARWEQGLAERDDVASAVARHAPGRGDLDDARRVLLDHWQRDVSETGSGLGDEERFELRALRERLIQAPGRFMAALSRPVTVEVRRDEVSGIPRGVVNLFGDVDAAGRWTVTLNDPIVNGVLTSAADRGLRERVCRAWLRRGFPDNLELLDEVATIRQRMATLLGFPSFRALRAPGLAIGGLAEVDVLLDAMEPPLAEHAATELARMQALLAAETGDPDVVVEEWDWRYLDARQRAQGGVDPDVVRDYLPFEEALAGLARLSDAVFGVALVPRPGRRHWHPEVRSFHMVDRDTGALIARLEVDPFARPGKQGGAFADVLDPGDPGTLGEGRPRVLALVTNAPPPGGSPSTIGFVELEMLFHEYGHVLDYALDRSPHWPVREAWLPFDWMEAPSLFLGRWGQHPRILSTFARHVETGEPIAAELLAGLERLESLNAGVRALRFLSMARLDVLLHGPDPVPAREADRLAWDVRLIPPVDEAAFAGTFEHLVVGYEAAVYGFLWAQCLRDDLFRGFEQTGLVSPAAGERYRESVLSAPWTEHPLDGVRRFLGREPSWDAFLGRLGAGGVR